MAYTKKTWVNVPDPSNPPSIPEGQDSLARFDADNMNRIESGIEEVSSYINEVLPHINNESNPHGVTASQVGLGKVPNVATNDQTPTYSTASKLETLASGEKISIAFGKIKKAITDFISHLADTTKHNSSTSGVVIGESSQLIGDYDRGVAIGNGSLAKDGVSIGYNARGNNGVSIGYGAESNGVSIGYNAKTMSNGLIDAIQLGTGTNPNANTLQVYDYQLMDANGAIPGARLWTPITTKTFTATFTAQQSQGRAFEITGIDFTAYDEIRLVANMTVTLPKNASSARYCSFTVGKTDSPNANTGSYVNFASFPQASNEAAVTLTDKATLTLYGQRYSNNLMYANQYSGTPVGLVEKDGTLYFRAFITNGSTSSTGNATINVELSIYGKGAI